MDYRNILKIPNLYKIHLWISFSQAFTKVYYPKKDLIKHLADYIAKVCVLARLISSL